MQMKPDPLCDQTTRRSPWVVNALPLDCRARPFPVAGAEHPSPCEPPGGCPSGAHRRVANTPGNSGEQQPPDSLPSRLSTASSRSRRRSRSSNTSRGLPSLVGSSCMRIHYSPQATTIIFPARSLARAPQVSRPRPARCVLRAVRPPHGRAVTGAARQAGPLPRGRPSGWRTTHEPVGTAQREPRGGASGRAVSASG